MVSYIARMVVAGFTEEAIAQKMGVSDGWLKMVMGTDAFTFLVRKYHAEDQDAEGGRADQAAQAGEGQ